MAPSTPQSMGSLGNVLVVGGCGFLGHHIVDRLHSHYNCKISVIDLSTTRNRRPDSDGITYFDGDITKLDGLVSIFEKVKPDVVIHTASPVAIGDKAYYDLFKRVNVDGTRCVIEACQKTNVKALVFTSSASVVSDNISTELINADERWPVISGPAQSSYYTQTKLEAEALVLAANRAPNSRLLTCSIRPAAIHGEGDVQLIAGLLNVYYDNKNGFQIGNNENLHDFTYVGNIAHAHLLAASALLTTYASSTAPLNHEKVDGEAFFITSETPVYFWDFARMVWKTAGSTKGLEDIWVIPRPAGIFLATVMEWVMWALGKKATLTVLGVKIGSMTRYFNISKAKRRLGYKPLFTLEEGIERSVRHAVEERRVASEKKAQ